MIENNFHVDLFSSLETDTAMQADMQRHREAALAHRPENVGIKVSSYRSSMIDLGLWIRRTDEGWTMKTYVPDVPSMIPDGHVLEEMAATRLVEKSHRRDQPVRIFPEWLITSARIHPGQNIPAIAFKMEFDHDCQLKAYKVSPSSFRSLNNGGAESLCKQFNVAKQSLSDWEFFSRNSALERMRDFSQRADEFISTDEGVEQIIHPEITVNKKIENIIFDEAVINTDLIAGKFLKEKCILVPSKLGGVGMLAASVTPDFEFDLLCNKICWDAVNNMNQATSPGAVVTSVTNNYHAYLTLKIMGLALAGQAIKDEIHQHVSDVSGQFNKRTQARQKHMSEPGWYSVWNQMRRNRENPFARTFDGPHNSHAQRLIEYCRGQELKWPLLAERSMMVQGVIIYFAGMQAKLPDNTYHTWAFSDHPDTALEKAADRMFKKLDTRAPETLPKLALN